MAFDEGLAKLVQQGLNTNSMTFTATTALTNLGTAYSATHCGRNVYKQAAALPRDIKSVAKAAAKYWYSGHAVYDSKTGDMTKYDDKSKKLYENFARMLWASSTKVAFGMIDVKGQDLWVVAYYCYDKPAVSSADAGFSIK